VRAFRGTKEKRNARADFPFDCGQSGGEQARLEELTWRPNSDAGRDGAIEADRRIALEYVEEQPAAQEQPVGSDRHDSGRGGQRSGGGGLVRGVLRGRLFFSDHGPGQLDAAALLDDIFCGGR